MAAVYPPGAGAATPTGIATGVDIGTDALVGFENVVGGAGSDTITGNAANNKLTGGGGNDHIDGAAGEDTAIYATALSASKFSYDSGTNTWTVDATAGGEGTDSLTHIEKVAGADADGAGPSSGRFLLVDPNGSYTTIQAAIDAASAGDTILIAAGIYTESLTIATANLTFIGLGNVVLTGPLLTQLGVPSGTHLDDFFEQNHPNYSQSTGISINASGASITGLTITGFADGVALGARRRFAVEQHLHRQRERHSQGNRRAVMI